MPTKICLFEEEEDLGRIKSLYFFNIDSFKTIFLLFFEKLYNTGLNLRFLGNFLFFSICNSGKFFSNFANKKSIRNTKNSFESKIFFGKVIKKSNPNTVQTLPKMRNPPFLKISNCSHNKHIFFGVTKLCLL